MIYLTRDHSNRPYRRHAEFDTDDNEAVKIDLHFCNSAHFIKVLDHVIFTTFKTVPWSFVCWKAFELTVLLSLTASFSTLSKMTFVNETKTIQSIPDGQNQLLSYIFPHFTSHLIKLYVTVGKKTQ